MGLDEEDLESVCNFIEKVLIANNVADHKLDTIAKCAKYDNTVMMLKMDFQRYFFKDAKIIKLSMRGVSEVT